MLRLIHAHFSKMLKTQAGRNLLALKLVVAVGIICNHYFPGHLGVFTNLLWLFAF